jgi:hypothetical protein
MIRNIQHRLFMACSKRRPRQSEAGAGTCRDVTCEAVGSSTGTIELNAPGFVFSTRYDTVLKCAADSSKGPYVRMPADFVFSRRLSGMSGTSRLSALLLCGCSRGGPAAKQLLLFLISTSAAVARYSIAACAQLEVIACGAPIVSSHDLHETTSVCHMVCCLCYAVLCQLCYAS